MIHRRLEKGAYFIHILTRFIFRRTQVLSFFFPFHYIAR